MELFDVYSLYNICPVKGQGSYIWDEKGKKYLDLYGGHAVISIGHAHPHYVQKIQAQVARLSFYSNSVQNPLQQTLADKLAKQCGLDHYQLFFTNSGAESNENALKLASFHTGKKRILAFKDGFHGRTSAAVAATDNASINAPLNKQHSVSLLPFNDLEALKSEISKEDCCALIFESIQGIGGLNSLDTEFLKEAVILCKSHNVCVIADEVQAGYGRTGDFFGYQRYGIEPDIITLGKGMGNGFPIGGVLIHPDIKARKGMLGSTFAGNHLACTAGIAVLEVIEKENLLAHAKEMGTYFQQEAQKLSFIKKVKGRGLMLGVEFEKEIAPLRSQLIYDYQIFTGSSKNKKLLRILPPLNIQRSHIDHFLNTLQNIFK